MRPRSSRNEHGIPSLVAAVIRCVTMRSSRSSLVAISAATSLLSVALSPLASAMCAMVIPSASIVTPLTSPIPKDGGLLVRIDQDTSSTGPRVAVQNERDFELPAMALVQGETRIPIVVTNLRAGLLRLSFERAPEDGDYTLEGFTPAEGPGLSIAIGGTLPPAPTAPLVSSVVHQERTRTSEGHRGEERVTSWTTRVSLAHALPAHTALAAIRPAGRAGAYQVFDASGGRSTLDDRGSLGGHCGAGFLPGRGRAWHAMRAELVTLDRFGRVSPPSAPFTVR
jgi:hypothetical protein